MIVKRLDAAIMESNPYQSPSPIADTIHAPLVPADGGWKLVLVAAMLTALLWLLAPLNFPVLIFLGWTVSRAWPRQARTICRCAPLIGIALIGILAITGAVRLHSSMGEVHRWTAHGLLVLLYATTPFALGVLGHQKLRRRPILSIVQSLAILFCLAASFSAALTGYLDRDPVPDPVIAEETHHRFVVLHMFVLPVILTYIAHLALVLWVVSVSCRSNGG